MLDVNRMKEVDICIIGFGVSGISMTRWAKDAGLSIICLEKTNTFGGVWSHKSYKNVSLQTTKNSYSFSDEPMPHHFPLHPSGDDIKKYLSNYIDKYFLSENVFYNSEVINIKKNNDGRHRVLYHYNGQKQISTIISKYIAICSGFYTIPRFPPIENKEVFEGSIQHASDFSPSGENYNFNFKDKKVVVIGNGPSGCDLAILAVDSGAKSVTILYRTPRWIFTRYFGILGLNFFTNRLFLWLGSKLPITLFLALMYLIFYLPYYSLGLNTNLELPNKIVNRNNLTLNEKFIIYLNQKKFNYIQATNYRLSEKGINYQVRKSLNGQIDDKFSHTKANIIICSTGYEIGVPFKGLNKIPKLYKRCLDPDDITLAYIGFSPSFNWVQLSDLQARWFVNTIIKGNKIPDYHMIKSTLLNDILINKDQPFEYYDLAYLAYSYCDDLAKDMNIIPRSQKRLVHYLTVPKYNEWTY